MPGPPAPTGIAHRSYYEANQGPDVRDSKFSHRANRDYYRYKNMQDGKNAAINEYNAAKTSRAPQGRLEQLARSVVAQTQKYVGRNPSRK